ncbi:helix-hairpin-helix domain-containing protein [Candidatus Pacearchaeota archaeon]|nr:helix-hairpin-helix domain-containing protein [Candidatus Pacearchaeota archaeon]
MKYVLLILLLTSFAIAECSDGQIDINSASIEDLDELVWVGPSTAEKIINERPFDSVDDLDKVHGIGDVKVADIIEEGLACVEDEDNENNIEAKRKTEKEIVEVVLEEPREKVVYLNDEKAVDLNDEIFEEVVYESKNVRVWKYLPYGFAVFLIIIIAMLVYNR